MDVQISFLLQQWVLSITVPQLMQY